MPLYREADNLSYGVFPIPYNGLTASFYSRKRQTLIPFLGAGASLPSPPAGDQPAQAPPAPDPAMINRVCQTIGVADPGARILLELAVAVALRMQSRARAPGTVYQRLADSASPPSAADLAEAFAEAANYNHFEWALQRIRSLKPSGAWDQAGLLAVLRAMSDLLGLGSPTPSLLEVASYYEYTFRRQRLRDFLAGIFNERKSEPTRTHSSVAGAAQVYIDANNSDEQAGDYLIITTNYDGLLEIALDRAQVPYAVLTVPREDLKVDVHFHGVQQYLNYSDDRYARFCEGIRSVPPRDLSALGKRSKPIAVLYKIHGDLYPPGAQPRPDSIIISDDDYVRYIQDDARIGMVPAFVTDLMDKKDLLVLGYRFADWNVRSLYLSIVKKRVAGDQQDWVVSRAIGRQERGFFDSSGIHMMETSLDRFWTGIGPPPGSPPPGAGVGP